MCCSAHGPLLIPGSVGTKSLSRNASVSGTGYDAASQATRALTNRELSTMKQQNDTVRNSAVIGAVSLFLEALTDEVGDKTMGVQQVQLLLALHIHGEINQVDLPRYTGVEKSSNSRHIAALGLGAPVVDKKTGARSVERGLGWVEAYEEPTNRRFKMVRLTPLGKAQLDAVAARVAARLLK